MSSASSKLQWHGHELYVHHRSRWDYVGAVIQTAPWLGGQWVVWRRGEQSGTYSELAAAKEALELLALPLSKRVMSETKSPSPLSVLIARLEALRERVWSRASLPTWSRDMLFLENVAKELDAILARARGGANTSDGT